MENDPVRSITVSFPRRDAERRNAGFVCESSDDMEMTESSDPSKLDSVRERASIRFVNGTLGFAFDESVPVGVDSLVGLEGEKLNKSDRSLGTDLDEEVREIVGRTGRVSSRSTFVFVGEGPSEGGSGVRGLKR